MKDSSPNPGNAFLQYAIFVAVLAFFLVGSLLILAQGLAPTILSLAPASINAGNAGFTLTVNGTGFSSLSSSLHWNGSPQATTFVSPTQVTAAIPGTLLTSAGINGITVVNSFGTSNVVSFAVYPTVSSLNPASVTAGGPGFNLLVNGAGFICDGDLVLWNGSSRAVTGCTNTQLAASISANDIATAGTASIVVNSSQLTSNQVVFVINNPVPAISSLSPASVFAGTGPLTLTVNGSNFVSGSFVRLNGTPYPTTFVSSRQLTASISAIAVSSATTASVTVANPPPGGGISNAVDFIVTAPLTFSYSVSGQTPVSVLPGGTVALPATEVGSSSAVQFQIVNAGSTPATVSSVSASGAVFSLSGVPTLPFTLPANGNLSFTVGFAPTAPGNSTGALTINNSSFALTGSATISPLTYRYALPGGQPVNLSPGGTIPFQSVAAGGSSSAQFQIVNPSSGPASVTAVTSNSPLFTLDTLPTFPATIPAGGSLDLSLTFRPTTPVSSTATLTAGTRTFSLSGTGLATGVSLTGLTDVVSPAQQPRVGVDLTAASAVPLTGQLDLTFTPTADVPSDDPAVQFATGGRTANFTVPANSTKSDFAGSPDIAFSTGTVAGTLRLVVTLKNGSADVTPTSPDPNRTVTVERRAPTITSVTIASRTTSGFEIVIVGYSTTRSLSQAGFRFTPRAGSNVQSGDVTVNVTSQFTTWYQSAESQQFGSQFRLRIPFTVQGDINALGSVSVTLTNVAGTSQPTSTSF